MSQGLKQELAAQVGNLRALRQTPEFKGFVRLIELMLTDAKERLVDVAAADFSKVQGEAQAYQKIMRSLTRETVERQ